MARRNYYPQEPNPRGDRAALHRAYSRLREIDDLKISLVSSLIALRRSKAPSGSFASILPCPRSRPLSTTPDIATSNGEPSACRLPAPDLQRTSTAAATPASWLRSIWRHVTHVRSPKISACRLQRTCAGFCCRVLGLVSFRSQFGEGPRGNGGQETTDRMMAR